jgi:glycosyltransferase involved in cell wall biosynthesis
MQKKIDTIVLGVLVLMPVYNHEKYIRQAIEGVLFQITNFPVVLYISDDASIDKSFDVISEYSSRSYIEIVSERQKENLGAFGNGAYLRNVARNSKFKYVSILEGDDYWTDSFKLQKQVDFLEANSAYTAAVHQVMFTNEKNELYPPPQRYLQNDITLRDLFTTPFAQFIPTCSIVMQQSFAHHPIWQEKVIFADYALHLMLACEGPIRMLQENMAVYRKHAGGISFRFNWDSYARDYHQSYMVLLKHLPKPYHTYIHQQLFKTHYASASHFLAAGNVKRAFEGYKTMLRFLHRKELLPFGKLTAKLLMLPLYRIYQQLGNKPTICL